MVVRTAGERLGHTGALRARLSVVGLLCVLASSIGWSAPRPPGCAGESQAQDRAIQLFRQARAKEQFSRAATAAWRAWCASGSKEYLVHVCTMHVRAQNCQGAEEVLSYIARRGSLGGELQARLDQCERDRETQCTPAPKPAILAAPAIVKAAPTASPTPSPAPEAPPAPPPPPAPAKPARLDLRVVATEPSTDGAFIAVDGVLRGQVPAMIEVSEGRHVLEVEDPGVFVWRATVEVRPGETRTIYPQPSQVLHSQAGPR